MRPALGPNAGSPRGRSAWRQCMCCWNAPRAPAFPCETAFCSRESRHAPMHKAQVSPARGFQSLISLSANSLSGGYSTAARRDRLPGGDPAINSTILEFNWVRRGCGSSASRPGGQWMVRKRTERFAVSTDMWRLVLPTEELRIFHVRGERHAHISSGPGGSDHGYKQTQVIVR